MQYGKTITPMTPNSILPSMSTHDQPFNHHEDDMPVLCRNVYLKPVEFQLLDIDENELHTCILKQNKASVQELVMGFNQKISYFFQGQEGLKIYQRTN